MTYTPNTFLLPPKLCSGTRLEAFLGVSVSLVCLAGLQAVDK